MAFDVYFRKNCCAHPYSHNLGLLCLQTTDLSFSLLRPYIYSTDGEFLSIHRYDEKCRLVRRVHNFSGNNNCVVRFTILVLFLCPDVHYLWEDGDFLLQDRASWVQGVNGYSHEMCFVGSLNGIVRLWDVNFEDMGNEIKGPVSMVRLKWLSYA